MENENFSSIRNQLRSVGNFKYAPMKDQSHRDDESFEEEEECDSIEFSKKLSLFLNGDTNQCEYFARHFQLRSLDAFNSITTPLQFFQFLMTLFFSSNAVQEFNSLMVIDLLLRLEGVDLSFFTNEQFLQKLIFNFRSNDKIYSRLSLDAITDILIDYPNVFPVLVNFGFLDMFLSVIDFSSYSQDEKDSHHFFEYSCEVASHCLYTIIHLKVYRNEDMIKLWYISTCFISDEMTWSSVDIGLGSMRSLIGSGLHVNPDDALIAKLAEIGLMGNRVIDGLLRLLLKFDRETNAIPRCFQMGLLEAFMSHIEHDSVDLPKIYDFLSFVKFFPRQIENFVDKTIQFVVNGSFETRIAVINYLAVVLDVNDIGLVEELIKKNVFSIFENIFDSDNGDAILVTMDLLVKLLSIIEKKEKDMKSLNGLDSIANILETLIISEDEKVAQQAQMLYNIIMKVLE